MIRHKLGGFVHGRMLLTGVFRQADDELGSLAFVASHVNLSAMGFDHLAGKKETHAGAFSPFGRKVGFEEMSEIGTANAGAGVLDGGDHPVAVFVAFEPEFAREARRGMLRHRFRRIFDEVHKDDFQLFGVSADRRHDGREVRPDPDAGFLQEMA